MSFLIFFFIFLGFANAAFLYWQFIRYKRTGKKIFCPMGGKCEEVVETSYGTIFGVKNEIMGMVYYVVLFSLLFVYSWFVPEFRLLLLTFIISSGAAGFSLYLLYVQTMVLKKFCSWCIAASLINFIIVILLALVFFRA